MYIICKLNTPRVILKRGRSLVDKGDKEMASSKKQNKQKKALEVINCDECKTQADCCRTGSWIDLDEAKKIAALGLKGEFFQLEKNKKFPSGYRIGTSYDCNPCTFLDADGLCAVHKVSYRHKPKTCKDFPYEDDEISSFVDVLCTEFKSKRRKK